jgi:hypothetical protein
VTRSLTERMRECERAEGVCLRQLARKLRRAVDTPTGKPIDIMAILDVASELAAVALVKIGPDIAGGNGDV